jgi:hypothetical protein
MPATDLLPEVDGGAGPMGAGPLMERRPHLVMAAALP